MTPTARYISYGTSIDSDVDLSAHLLRGKDALHQLRLCAAKEQSKREELDHRIYLYTNHGRDLHLCSERELGPAVPGQSWEFIVENVVVFRWQTGAGKIEYRLEKDGDEALLAFWLLHTLLPLYQSLEGHFDFLHAGAVDIDGAPVLFVAPSMGGKSTLTEYFVRRGHKLISDDKVATYIEQGRFKVVPSHTRYRPYRRNEDLGFRAEQYRETPGVVRAVYVLDRAGQENVRFHEVKGFRKFECLLPSYLFSFKHLERKRMEYLASVAGSVQLFEAEIPDDLARLGEVYEAICAHAVR